MVELQSMKYVVCGFFYEDSIVLIIVNNKDNILIVVNKDNIVLIIVNNSVVLILVNNKDSVV
jgi:hypothetical protein